MGNSTSLTQFDNSVKEKTGVQGSADEKNSAKQAGKEKPPSSGKTVHAQNTAASGNKTPKSAGKATPATEKKSEDDKDETTVKPKDKEEYKDDNDQTDNETKLTTKDEERPEKKSVEDNKPTAVGDRKVRQPSGIPRNMKPSQGVYQPYARRSRRGGSSLDEIEEVRSASKPSSSRDSRRRQTGPTTTPTTPANSIRGSLRDDRSSRNGGKWNSSPRTDGRKSVTTRPSFPSYGKTTRNYQAQAPKKKSDINSYSSVAGVENVSDSERSSRYPTREEEGTDEHGDDDNADDVDMEGASHTTGKDREVDGLRNRTMKRLKLAVSASKVVGVWMDESGSLKQSIYSLLEELTSILFSLKSASEFLKISIRQEMGNVLVEEKAIQNLCAVFLDVCQRDRWKRNSGAWKVLDDCKYLLHSFTDTCQDVTVEVCRAKGFLDMLGQIMKSSHDQRRIEDRGQSLLLSTVGIVYNCSAFIDNIKPLRQAALLPAVVPILKTNHVQLRILALGVTTALATEVSCTAISQNFVLTFFQTMEAAMRAPSRRHDGWSARECGALLVKLARHDSNKKQLADQGALRLLADMAETGNSEEQLQAVRALRQLAFDNEVKDKFVKEIKPDIVGLLAVLREWTASYADLGESSEIDTEELKEAETKLKIKEECDGTLWNLRHKLLESPRFKSLALQFMIEEEDPTKQHNQSVSSEKSSGQETDQKAGQVYISYQAASADHVAKIREHLHARGYRVTASSNGQQKAFRAMRQNIHHADVIVVCVSERYKDSANCRTEAEYFLERQKRFIALDMDADYSPDGWLREVIGLKKCLDFRTDHFMGEKLEGLVKAIESEIDVDRYPSNKDRRRSPLPRHKPSPVEYQEDSFNTQDPEASVDVPPSQQSRYTDTLDSTVTLPETRFANYGSDIQDVSRPKPTDKSKPTIYRNSTPQMEPKGEYRTPRTPASIQRTPSQKSFGAGDPLEITSSITTTPLQDKDASFRRQHLDKVTSQVRRWSRDDINNWIIKHRLRRSTFGVLSGDDIALLLSMYQEAPEAFYNSLQDWLRIDDLPSASKVVWALKDILNVDQEF